MSLPVQEQSDDKQSLVAVPSTQKKKKKNQVEKNWILNSLILTCFIKGEW